MRTEEKEKAGKMAWQRRKAGLDINFFGHSSCRTSHPSFLLVRGKKSLVWELARLALVGMPLATGFAEHFIGCLIMKQPGNSNVHLAIKFCSFLELWSWISTKTSWIISVIWVITKSSYKIATESRHITDGYCHRQSKTC